MKNLLHSLDMLRREQELVKHGVTPFITLPAQARVLQDAHNVLYSAIYYAQAALADDAKKNNA